MKKFVKGGVLFTSFEHDGEVFLCTGNPTGKLKLAFTGEIADYAYVDGATSVVSGDGSIGELYDKWLEQTKFYREVLGIKY